MPRVRTRQPEPSRDKGQRSLDLPLYLTRILPQWTNPQWVEGELWRRVVERQPFAIICRETLTSNVLALDWKIEPKDSEKRDEYKKEIQYHEDFFTYNGEYDYSEIIEWICGDLLDLPFGAAAEVGHEGDSREGKIVWLNLLDGTTLFPTLNVDWPVGQAIKEASFDPVYFPAHAINRIIYSPRRDIKRKGWGTAPPEKIYLALELINRGDIYYANLLLDTPEAGILDLGDMAKNSAEEWVESWRKMLNGIDPFKIPVLFEHEKPATWIPFTRSPTELMFDKALMKYGATIAAGYGMTLSDIGFQSVSSGGDTLAGSIRQERHTRKTGFARLKKKLEYWFNRMLPEYLEWKFIDQDDELMTNLGRSRLANANAWKMYIENRIFTPEEARQQTIADGLITISVPESVPDESEFPAPPTPFGGNGKSPQSPAMIGKPVTPSQGGHGEIKSEILDAALINDAEFREAWNEVDKLWDELGEEERNEAINTIKAYLTDYEAKNYDTISIDNIEKEEIKNAEKEEVSTIA